MGDALPITSTTPEAPMAYLPSDTIPVVCPHCFHEVRWPLPAQPLFTIQEALDFIPVSRGYLYVLLHRLRQDLDPPQYAHGEYGRRYRLLTAKDIRTILQRSRPTMAGVLRWFRSL